MAYDFSIVKRFKRELIELIDYSYDMDPMIGFREVGASICEDKNGKLRLAYGGMSENPYVAELGKCREDERAIVDFHTHYLSRKFSEQDISASKQRNAEIVCIGLRRKQKYEVLCLRLKDMSTKKFLWSKQDQKFYLPYLY